MAETLLAVILVTSSAKGSSLVFHWPPTPTPSARLARPRPELDLSFSHTENTFRAAYFPDVPSGYAGDVLEGAEEYEWRRPQTAYVVDDVGSRAAHSESGRSSPVKDGSYVDVADHHAHQSQQHAGDADENTYEELLGFSAEFLAGMLCPQRALCHQKFELVVDDVAFIGHPVCAETDARDGSGGQWRFKPEKLKLGTRGRGSRNRADEDKNLDKSYEKDVHDSAAQESGVDESQPIQTSSLQTFHLALVIDLPDPSSSAAGNLSKYFDVIYEHIAFTVTAVLFQEQVLHNFVEMECDALGTLKDECMAKREPYENFSAIAIKESSIASSMKTLYEAIKCSTIARLTIHEISIELQLPPHLDTLLHSAEDNAEDDYIQPDPEPGDGHAGWGREMSFAWRLPTLAPWKSLLLLDDADGGIDPLTSLDLRGPHLSAEDRALTESLIKFLQTASVTLSLADMADLLDWDLDSRVFPTVRWLVHHRRAKVVDIVHPTLKSVFTLPPKFDTPLSILSEQFRQAFPDSSISSLPHILCALSAPTSTQTDTNNHFFATVVKSNKELVQPYHNVVLWMLKRDLLVRVHLRVRVVVTAEVKAKVRAQREGQRAARRRFVQEAHVIEDIPVGVTVLLDSTSPSSSNPDNGGASGGDDTGGTDDDDDNDGPSLIPDPGRATVIQRRWLEAMSDGKAGDVVKRFERINQYFDGRKTDDEILYRAEISRKQLREVLHHYDEFLQTFLHPS